jgi:hypothetical protein
LRGSGGGGGGETFGVCFLILGGWGLWGERERDRERESFNPLYSYPFVPEQSRYKGEHILHFANPQLSARIFRGLYPAILKIGFVGGW